MWRGARSICSTGPGLGMWMAMGLAWTGALSANEMAVCLHQHQQQPPSLGLSLSISISISLSLDIGLLLKLNEYLKRRKDREERKKPKRNETKQNETFATAPFGATKDIFPLKAFAGKSCLNLATDTCVCSGWGRVGGRGAGKQAQEPEEKPYWKQCAINNINISNTTNSNTIIIICVAACASLGLVIVFRTCDTIADDIANDNADTKTPSSMICGMKEKSKTKYKQAEQKKEEVWQQKC